MVQFIQLLPRRDIGGQIGSAFGNAFQQGAQQATQQQFQRSQLQKALASLNNIPQGSTPFQIATNLLSATAGLPDQGRIVSSLFPLLAQQVAGQNVSKVPPPGNISSPGIEAEQNKQIIPQNQENISYQGNDPTALLNTAQKQFPNLPQPSQTPDIFTGILEPTKLGLGPIPNTYSEQEIGAAEQKDAAQGLTDSPTAAFMRRYNDSARQRINDITNAAQVQATIGAQHSKRQEEFRNVLSEQIHSKDPSDLAVAETIASRPEFKNISNDKIKAERVAKEFNIYEASRDEFSRAARRPNPLLKNQDYENSIRSLGNKAKTMIKYGQREKAMELLAKNGWSESEIAKILNPLNIHTKQQLDKLPSFEKPIVFSGNFPVAEKFEKQNRDVFNKWESFLEKAIKPGNFDPKNPDVFTPGTSLILLRNAAISKGISGINFDSLLNRAIQEGKIELDPYQQREIQLMTQDPRRSWSLYETMFGGFKS